jgi:pimeloyl-ACP methyl ester carboxylesterase
MKKFFIGTAVIVVIALVSAYVFRQQIMLALMGSQIAPEHDFSKALAPPPPDYNDPLWWAALPSSDDPGDQLPPGVIREPSGVAVFFVHPTSYFGKTNWNQPLSEQGANWVVDQRVLRHQATVFNSCCDIYAPRYRQATFFAFMDSSGNGAKALELAYTDVVAAFRHFLREIEQEQPFIIAGHSQGSRHAAQLVAEHISGTPLLDRMVAAYLVGFGVTDKQLGEVPVCAQAQQTRCALGWNAMDGPGAGAFGGNEGLICTNPLNWHADDSYAGHELNRGAIGYPSYGAAAAGEDVSAMPLEAGVADAQCQPDGQLAVLELRSDAFPQRMFGNSMHVYDYSLFHDSIRANVAARIRAFQTSIASASSR